MVECLLELGKPQDAATASYESAGSKQHYVEPTRHWAVSHGVHPSTPSPPHPPAMGAREVGSERQAIRCLQPLIIPAAAAAAHNLFEMSSDNEVYCKPLRPPPPPPQCPAREVLRSTTASPVSPGSYHRCPPTMQRGCNERKKTRAGKMDSSRGRSNDMSAQELDEYRSTSSGRYPSFSALA